MASVARPRSMSLSHAKGVAMPDHLELQETFHFRPRWWWDPVPPWVFKDLDPRIVIDLAQVQLDVQEAVLKAQLDAIGRTREVLQQVK